MTEPWKITERVDNAQRLLVLEIPTDDPDMVLRLGLSPLPGAAEMAFRRLAQLPVVLAQLREVYESGVWYYGALEFTSLEAGKNGHDLANAVRAVLEASGVKL